MKKSTLLLLSVVLLGSCTSTDDENDGKCKGAFREYDLHTGELLWEYETRLDCASCGYRVYYECPEPGTCGDYYGVQFDNIIGTFECN